MAKDTGAKAKLNHKKKLGERAGKMNCIHMLAKLWTVPTVKETSKDAMKNFMLNNIVLLRKQVVTFLLYALLLVVACY